MPPGLSSTPQVEEVKVENRVAVANAVHIDSLRKQARSHSLGVGGAEVPSEASEGTCKALVRCAQIGETMDKAEGIQRLEAIDTKYNAEITQVAQRPVYRSA